jgi:hypothetical protein
MSRPNVTQVNALQSQITIAGSGRSLTVDATVGGVQLVAAAVPEDTRIVKIQVQGADVRMTTDGTAPVATTTGDLLRADTWVYLSRQQALAAKFIRETATSATVRSEALTS